MSDKDQSESVETTKEELPTNEPEPTTNSPTSSESVKAESATKTKSTSESSTKKKSTTKETGFGQVLKGIFSRKTSKGSTSSTDDKPVDDSVPAEDALKCLEGKSTSTSGDAPAAKTRNVSDSAIPGTSSGDKAIDDASATKSPEAELLPKKPVGSLTKLYHDFMKNFRSKSKDSEPLVRAPDTDHDETSKPPVAEKEKRKMSKQERIKSFQEGLEFKTDESAQSTPTDRSAVTTPLSFSDTEGKDLKSVESTEDPVKEL